MAETLGAEDIKRVFNRIAERMEEEKDHLCKLDGALGDGDIGLTMAKGFRAVADALSSLEQPDIGQLLLKSTQVMGEKAASTMGTLLTTALLRAGKAMQGKTELTLADLHALTEAMANGLGERGKAKLGDKTILDAFVPAVEAIAAALSRQASISEALHAAAEAAEAGMELTIGLQSRHGRAARYLEKSIGHQDPGATVAAIFFRTIAETVLS